MRGWGLAVGLCLLLVAFPAFSVAAPLAEGPEDLNAPNEPAPKLLEEVDSEPSPLPSASTSEGPTTPGLAPTETNPPILPPEADREMIQNVTDAKPLESVQNAIDALPLEKLETMLPDPIKAGVQARGTPIEVPVEVITQVLGPAPPLPIPKPETRGVHDQPVLDYYESQAQSAPLSESLEAPPTSGPANDPAHKPAQFETAGTAPIAAGQSRLMGPWPFAALSAIALSVAAVLAQVSRSRPGGLQGAFGWLLFSHVSRESALVHPLRQQLLQLIAERPGVSLRELMRLTDKSRNNIVYHLAILQRHGLVLCQVSGQTGHYFSAKAKATIQVAMLQDERRRLIVEYVSLHPLCTQKQVSEALGIPASRVHDHLRKLCEVGLVTKRSSGKARQLQATPQLSELGVFASGRPFRGAECGANNQA